MKTKMDVAYQDLKGKISYKILVFTDDVNENMKVLEEAFKLVNITKGDLLSQDIELPGSTSYLIYLLQFKSKVNLGLCPKVKIWFNTYGVQNRCLHNDREIPVLCSGNLCNCSLPANKPTS